MRTLRRLKFMSSPSLSDLGKREPASAADERGTQQRRACANATWNSIHNGVIAVFQRKGLPDQELFSLNEGVRQLLKTELGSFFTEYLQNQLLTKGMVILRDKIRFYEGQKLLDSLAETWDFFFSDVLPMLQAIFYPVQGKEPSVRQLALLHFRNAITLSVKLEDALARAHARVPPAIVQMLLVLQGVHESRGVTEDYLRLETLVQKVVSPYLGTYGLHSSEGPFTHSCILGSPHPQDGIPALTLHGGPVPICPHRSPTTWPHGSPVWTSCRPPLHPLGHQLRWGGGCTCLGKCRRPAGAKVHTLPQVEKLRHGGKAPPPPLPFGGRAGQEPGGALQELQHATAEPRAGARGRGRGGRRPQHPQALRVGDDVLPRAPGLLRPVWPGLCRGLQVLPSTPLRALPQQTLPHDPAP
ncbi:proline-rich protein 5 isoform X1 [Piliocolobus tephrosceles]|uniref:proline-rich protein 5 isoform X1 n=3 Tax=Piliocolobus tephrosceles TaxID=591936 RepID=UPI000C2B3BCD|nr:proline-rich protein 5 isoform X1 [Piliocolobus tephrosceles]